MPRRKVVRWCVLGGALLLLLAAGVLYWKVSCIPQAYRLAVAELTQAERSQAAKSFWNRMLSGEDSFNIIAQRRAPGTWQATQKELNQYLASIDEIAWHSGDAKRGNVDRQMAKAGISEPAAVLGDRVLTLMFRARDYNKIVSADITFSHTDKGKLKVRLAETRVGSLTIPAGLVRGRLNVLKEALSREASKGRNRPAPDTGRKSRGPTVADLGRVLAALIAAIDEDPIETEFNWPVNKKRVRIDAIRIEPGLLSLEVTPLGKAKRKKG